ncbi:MAG: recombinase family protein [Oscillospiraceae bacterium]|nr:recombinase family protein [Oscillospiraceae bacterium]
MAWQRKIPFGYQMRHGVIACEQDEAEAVKRIFALYLQSESLQRIAKAMTQSGIRYHQHTEQWNKHMVKRILENGHYLGDEQYPRLIDSDAYLAVRLLKEDKNVHAPCAVNHDIREKVVCVHCGARMVRSMKYRKNARWECGSCSHSMTVSDGTLTSAVDRLLDTLVRDPQCLAEPIPPAPAPSQNAFRIMNELTNAFNRGTESSEYLRSLIFAVAAERYNELPDTTLQYKLDRLRARVESGECDKLLRQELLKTAVRAIRLTSRADITLELVNGQIVDADGKEARET